MIYSQTKGKIGLSLGVLTALAIGAFFAMRSGNADTSSAIPENILTVETQRLTKLNAYNSQTLYPGRVRALRRSQLGFERGGLLADVLVDEGQTLAKGALLAQLDLRAVKAEQAAAQAALAAAKAALLDAKASADLAQATTGRQAELLAKGHISQQRFDDARFSAASADARVTSAKAQILQARAQLDAATTALELSQLTAPFTGTIVARFADEGTVLAPGTPILDFEETGIREFVTGVPGGIALSLSKGAVFRVKINGNQYDAQLKRIVTSIDTSTRTAQLIFDLPPSAQAPSGSVGQLSLSQSIKNSGFWVPLEALQEGRRGLWSVLVAAAIDAPKEDGLSVLERRPVELLHSELGRAFVKGTIQSGDQLVTGGLNRLIAGQQVRTTPVDTGR